MFYRYCTRNSTEILCEMPTTVWEMCWPWPALAYSMSYATAYVCVSSTCPSTPTPSRSLPRRRDNRCVKRKRAVYCFESNSRLWFFSRPKKKKMETKNYCLKAATSSQFSGSMYFNAICIAKQDLFIWKLTSERGTDSFPRKCRVKRQSVSDMCGER